MWQHEEQLPFWLLLIHLNRKMSYLWRKCQNAKITGCMGKEKIPSGETSFTSAADVFAWEFRYLQISELPNNNQGRRRLKQSNSLFQKSCSGFTLYNANDLVSVWQLQLFPQNHVDLWISGCVEGYSMLWPVYMLESGVQLSQMELGASCHF